MQTLSKLGIKGNFFNLTKGIYGEPTTDIIHNDKVSTVRNKTRMSTVTTSFSTGSSQGIRQEKETKGIQIRKEEVKIFVDDVFVYTENPKESTNNYQS